MKLSRRKVNEFYDTVAEMRDKFVRIMKIKAKLEKRKAVQIRLLRKAKKKGITETGPELWNQYPCIRELMDLYKKESRIIGIARKGIPKIRDKKEELDRLLAEAGVDFSVMKHFSRWVQFWKSAEDRQKENVLNMQSKAVLKYASTKLDKALKIMEEEFARVRGHFEVQYWILYKIEQGAGDPNSIDRFLTEYNKEVKTIKHCYRRGVNDILIKVIKKISPKQASALVGIHFGVPGYSVTAVPLIACFGVQFGGILTVVLSILKYIGMGGLGAYWSSKAAA